VRILIIKTGALGDVVRTTFIAQALKAKYRKLAPKIFWVTSKNAKPFFINNVYVDRVISEEDKQKLKNSFFDLIINLEEEESLCKFISSLEYNKIIGFIYKNNKIMPTQTMREWFNMSALGEKPKNNILKKQNKKTHREIISEIIGIKNYQKYEPFLRLTSNQREFAENFLRRYNLKRSDLIIGINTGSADRWPKQLSVKKTAQLIDKLDRIYGAKILLFGGPNELQRNNEIIKSSKALVISTGCGNDLIEFPALISICNLFITSDSLGLHLALALKRKTISLLGPTSSAEIGMYEIGKKIIAKSKCLCCYGKNCKSMEKINIEEIVKEVKKLISLKITLIITAFNEPNLDKAIKGALNQKTDYEYQVIVSAPDDKTLDIAKSYAKKYKNIKVFKDPGKGKSYALNLIFSKINTEILILTDGDTYISDNSVQEIVNLFLDPEIGCVTGKPVPMENRGSKYGYWANFLFNAANHIRKQAFRNNSFIECSGYLFAFRKNKIKKFPMDVAEDTIIPHYFWEKGYKIGYAENAEVYVKNADSLRDWIKQKTRTHKSHGKINKYADIKTTPKIKSFKTETKGIFWLVKYPQNLREIFWTVQLIFARTITWAKYFLETKIFNKHYADAWERIESTK
jgi:heptosyltransferase II